MTVLIELKEKLKEFYGSCSGIVLPIVKFLLALAVFRGINSNLGYLKMLNSMYVVLILSLICAILPLNGMVFFRHRSHSGFTCHLPFRLPMVLPARRSPHFLQPAVSLSTICVR